MNKKNILCILFVSCVCILQAQVQNNPPMQQVLASAGGTKILPFGSIDYTIGECMVATYTSTTPVLVKAITQGFQQPIIASDTSKIISPLKFYSGITPNNDGENDKWQIDGIASFPDNIVTLFNRWGDMVWNGKNYDNVNIVWNGKNNAGALLPDATYFYILQTDGKTYKGWVELTK